MVLYSMTFEFELPATPSLPPPPAPPVAADEASEPPSPPEHPHAANAAHMKQIPTRRIHHLRLNKSWLVTSMLPQVFTKVPLIAAQFLREDPGSRLFSWLTPARPSLSPPDAVNVGFDGELLRYQESAGESY